jgi:repressor LexA
LRSMKPLTKRQKELLDFVDHFQGKKGYSPSFREIMAHFGYRSPATVFSHMAALKKKGVLEQVAPRRGLQVKRANQSHAESLEIPFVGMIQDRFPVELYTENKSFMVPKAMVRYPELTYLLQVHGDSLESEGMMNGDLLVIEARNHADVGELVIAKTGVETHVKYFYLEGSSIRLEDRRAFTTLLYSANEVTIQGVVIGLLRLYL